MRALVLCLLLQLMVSSPTSFAKDSSFRLSAGAVAEADVKATVPADLVVPINLSVTNPKTGDTATLTLSGFHSADAPDDVRTEVGFAADGIRPAAEDPVEKTLKIKLEQELVQLHIDARKVVIGKDQTGELTIVPNEGDPQTLTINLQWEKPQIFQRAANGQRADVIEISDTGVGLAFLDLASFGQLDGAFNLVTEAFLRDGTGDEVQLRLDLATTTCASKESAEKGGGLILTPTAPHCDEIPILVDGRMLVPGSSYRGWMEISSASGSLYRHAYTVTRIAENRVAVPVITGTTIAEDICVLGCRPRITLTLDEETGHVPLRVLAIKPVGTEPSELGSSAKLRAYLFRQLGDSTQRVDTDLWNVDRQDQEDMARRSLAAGDQVTLVFEPVEDLWPGEYKVEIQLEAENAKAEDQPKVELTFRVLQRRWVPLLVLMGSVFFSYLISRGIGTRQRHRKLRDAVKRLNDRGAEKAFRWTTTPVVQVRAELARIRDALARSNSFMRWVSVPTDLEERLAIVEKRLPALGLVSDLWRHWDRDTEESGMVGRRAKRCLREINQDLAETTADGEYSSDVLERLADLKRWEDPVQLAELYWLNLKTDILKLKSGFVLRSYRGPDSAGLGKLLADLSEGFGELEEAATAIHSIRDEIATAAAAGIDVSKLQKVVAVDLQLVRQLGQSLKNARDFVDLVDAQGLGALKGAVDQAVGLLAGSALLELWRDAAGTADQLELLKSSSPQNAERAIECVGVLKGRDDDWLETGLDELLAAIEVGATSQRERVRELLSQLESDELPANLQEAIERERQYAALKLIWEHRGVKVLDDDRRKLIEGGGDVEEFFTDVDDWAWENLEEQLQISKPEAGKELEELRLIEFEISPKTKGRGNNYLFKHGLQYEWEIYAGSSEKPLLKPVTQEPRVVQFIPQVYETVRVEAKAVRTLAGGKEQAINVEAIEFSTRESDELMWRRSFQRGELLALGVAMVVAVVTGMSSEFFAPTLMGSFETYLALIVWGIASERGTKLLKDFDTYVGSAKQI